MGHGSFFSSKIHGRLFWAVVLALLAWVGVEIYFKFGDWQSRLTVLALPVCVGVYLVAGYWIVIGMWALIRILYRLIGRTYMPELPVEAEKFDIALPSGSYFMGVEFGLAFAVALLLGLFVEGFSSELRLLQSNRYLLALLLAVALGFAASGVVMGRLVGRGFGRVLFVAGGNGRLVIRQLLRRRELQAAGLRVWRYEGKRSKRPICLYLDAGERTIRIGAPVKSKPEGQFYAEWTDWLAARGAIVRPVRRTHREASVRLAGKIVLAVAIAAVMIFCVQRLVAAGWFWLHWLAVDTTESGWIVSLGFCYKMHLPQYVGVWIGVLLLFSPLYGWLWRLALLPIPQAGLEAGACPVFVGDAVGGWPGQFLLLNRGSIREANGDLMISLGRRQWTIRRDQVIAVSRRGFFRPTDWLGHCMSPRTAWTELAWMDDEGTAHGVKLRPRAAGWGWRGGRALREALEAWRSGAETNRIAAWPRGRGWSAPALGLMFLIAGAALPLLHNELLIDKIFGGKWHSPSAAVRPAKIPGPPPMWFQRIRAYQPGVQLLYEPGELSKESDRYWRGDPLAGKFVRARPAELWYSSSYSWPDANEVLLNSDPFGSELFIAPRFGRYVHRRIYLIATDSFTEVAIMDPYRWLDACALYRNERIAFVFRDDGESTLPYRFAWADLKGGKIHRMHAVNSARLIFFPGGRYVLLNGNVVDLDHGTQREIEAPAKYDSLKIGYGEPFPSGDRLRLCSRGEQDIPTTASAAVRATWRPIVKQFIVEIDPVTARLREIASFPEDTRIISADGDRCLIRETTTTSQREEIYIYKLYDCATGKAREVTRLPAQQAFQQYHYISLIAGTTKIIEFWQGKGWRQRDIGG